MSGEWGYDALRYVNNGAFTKIGSTAFHRYFLKNDVFLFNSH